MISRSTTVLACVLLATVTAADEIATADRVVHGVNVREGPSTDTSITGVLRKGAPATLILSVPNWHQVRLADGTVGFVSKSWTKRIVTPPVGAAGAADMPFSVYFLDVGTGDSAIIDIGDKEIIIDGGNSVSVLTEFEKSHDVIDGDIELMLVTHGDTDHWKGLTRLLNFDGKNPGPPRVREFWEPGYDRDCNGSSNSGRAGYLDFIGKVQKLPTLTFKRPLEDFHPPAIKTGAIQRFSLPSIPAATFTLLHSAKAPLSDNTECSYLINNASIVLMVEIGFTKLLFTGDANGKERAEQGLGTPGHVEARLLAVEAAHPGALRADVLKVPHHGSETASTQDFIGKVNPQFVVISASTLHHLPRDTVVQRYVAPQRTILRTDNRAVFNNDHVVCWKEIGQALDCNYEAVILETRSRSERRPLMATGPQQLQERQLQVTIRAE